MSEALLVNTKYMLNFMSFPIVGSLVKNNIPNKLLSGPKTAEELSENTEIIPDNLFRYMRAVSYFGLFDYDPSSNRWSNTKESEILTSDLSKSLWEWHSTYFVMEMILHTDALLKTKKTPNEALGIPVLFDRIVENPEFLGKFLSCMTQLSNVNFKDIIDKIDLTGCSKVLDVGGADGTLALNLAKKNSDLEFSVFDRPEVAPIAENTISRYEMTEKVKFIGGNFFEKIPDGFDCLLMKHIVHDWSDEESLIILRNCRKVLNKGNKVFIIEQIVDQTESRYENNLAFDMLMFLAVGGKERNLEQFKALFDQSGFEITSLKGVDYETLIEIKAV